MTAEEWRAIPGVSDAYEVSDLGRVRSWKRTPGPRILAAPCRTTDGRPYLSLDKKSWPVHRLVVLAFLGPCPEGLETRHLDSDKTNNRVSNLAYGTHSENILDDVRNGVHYLAARTHCPRGHPYDEANTIVAGVRRRCRECCLRRSREWRARNKRAITERTAA